MFDAFLVTWRESAEALLIVVLLRECLLCAGWGQGTTLIRRGVWLAALSFCACAVVIADVASEPAFDALLTIAASIGVAMMAMGMAVSASGIRRRISDHMHRWAQAPKASVIVVGLVSLLVLREGLEVFILLRAIAGEEGRGTMWAGAFLGLVALGLSTRIWAWARARFGLLIVFRVSAVLLLLLAARLVVHGCQELLQARWLPIDHERWLAVASPFLEGGAWAPWVQGALMALPLACFLKTWWREAEFVETEGVGQAHRR